ncbi:hypothetical protein SAMN05421739_101432 [Pontibacter chinhatensis]|uniref:Uncharacterized protein n=1 Tax=Pontibacter chinhatensis TaxID=1436961 RepID=A0A1I2MRL7_9BACT|nr:hypothetical protein SAMN05421739_101432 [Pontibacter chinhatensis]
MPVVALAKLITDFDAKRLSPLQKILERKTEEYRPLKGLYLGPRG